MAHAKASIGTTNYATAISTGHAGHHKLTADEGPELVALLKTQRHRGFKRREFSAERADMRVPPREVRAELRFELRAVEEIAHSYANSAHLVLVRRSNASLRGADRPRSFFAKTVDKDVLRKDDVRPIGDEKLPADGNRSVFQRADLSKQRRRIDHRALRDEATCSGMKDPGRNQVQHVFFAANDERVSCVRAAGVTNHHRRISREKVDDLAFAFIAPLGSHHHERRHFPTPDSRAGCTALQTSTPTAGKGSAAFADQRADDLEMLICDRSRADASDFVVRPDQEMHRDGGPFVETMPRKERF